MSIIIVTNTANDGAGSLREALATAEANPGADTIRFDPSIAGETIYLATTLQIATGSEVVIDGDSDGDGDADVRISGDSNQNGNDASDLGVLLAVASGATATLTSMYFTDGYSKAAAGEDAMAGIDNQGVLSLTDSIVANMVALGGNGAHDFDLSNGEKGGDALAGVGSATGQLTITDSLFVNNQATAGDAGTGSIGFGGEGGQSISGILMPSGYVTLSRVGFVDGVSIAGSGGNGLVTGGDGGDALVGIWQADGVFDGSSGYGMATEIITNGSGGAGIAGGADGIAHDLRVIDGGSDANAALTLLAATMGTELADNVTVAGGAMFAGFSGDDIIDNAAGSGQLYGGGGNDTITTGGAGVTAYGSSGDDRIVLLSLVDAQLNGGTGDDTLDLSATTGSSLSFDLQAGTSGRGTMFNFEHLIGMNDATAFDTIRGTSGANTLSGLAGNDVLFGRGGSDELRGGQGDDTLDGGDGQDTLYGDFGSDDLGGGAGADILFGGTGADTLDGGTGADSMAGGSGHDIYVVDNAGDIVNEAGSTGTDTVHSALTSYSLVARAGLRGSVENLILSNGAKNGTGNGLANALTGNSAANVLNGAGGNDTLDGGGQNDRLDGGAGKDVLSGGLGHDDLFGGSQNDRLSGDNGNDDLIGGSGNDQLTGGAGRDVLSGGNGKDKLNAGTGHDVLDGGKGKDQLIGGGGKDKLVFKKGYGKDTVIDFKDNKDTIKFSKKLWKGKMNAQDLLDNFASMKGKDAVFKFSSKDVFKVKKIGDLDRLVDDIAIG